MKTVQVASLDKVGKWNVLLSKMGCSEINLLCLMVKKSETPDLLGKNEDSGFIKWWIPNPKVKNDNPGKLPL